MVENEAPIEGIEISRVNDHFYLTKTDAQGQKQQLSMSEAEIVFLSQSISQYTRKIALERTAHLPGVSLSFSFPVKHVRLSTDLNTHHILMTVYDEFGGDAGYSLSPHQARDLAEKTIALAHEAQKHLDTETKQ